MTANSCKDVGYDNYDFPDSWKPNNGISCPNPLPADGSGAPEQVRFCLHFLVLHIEHKMECLVLVQLPTHALQIIWDAEPGLSHDAIYEAYCGLVRSCPTATYVMLCFLTKQLIFLNPDTAHSIHPNFLSFYSSGTVPRYLSF